MSVGTQVNHRDDTLAKAEKALKMPYLGHSASLTAPGVEIHIPGTISHLIPLPDSYQQYCELTEKMNARLQGITQSNFQGGVILRDGSFQLVPAEVKAIYDDFVAKGYMLQHSIDQYSKDPALSIAVRKATDEMIFEVEKAKDTKRTLNLSAEIQSLAETFVKIAVSSHITDTQFLFETYCADIESAAPADHILLNEEAKTKLRSIVESSGIYSENGKEEATKWAQSIESMRAISRAV